MADVYQSPLTRRYATEEMSHLFSERRRTLAFRDLWIALATAEKDLGLPISEAQIEALRRARDTIDEGRIGELEKSLRHDVMAHVHAFGELAPEAMPILHLGATSCFVGDNADLLIFREALVLIEKKLRILLARLSKEARCYADLPILGATHYQAAQPTTLGKRICLWMMDLLFDLEEVQGLLTRLRLRGAKGTTGTQASFLSLFGGDEEKVRRLDEAIAEAFDVPGTYPITGQTYSRKVDAQILQALGNLGASLHKMTNDLRLMQHDKEVEEPFEKHQIGSSAMAYKRNPMRSERIASLSKYLMNLAHNGPMVHATQWLERTLDDSANRRLAMAEAFLTADGLLELAINVVSGLVVHEKTIRRRLMEEVPFLATEELLMDGVKAGGNRQELHEIIRVHAQEAAKRVKDEGKENDLLHRLAADPAFLLKEEDIPHYHDPARYIGRAPSQVLEFLEAIDDQCIPDDYEATIRV